MIHELKTWPEYFNPVWQGTKPFEIRKNDRDYKVGDKLLLKEWEPQEQRFTGVMVCKEVTYILDDPAFVKEGYVVMGMKVSE